jgi:ABC-type uncharacterized transport system permease subunit
MALPFAYTIYGPARLFVDPTLSDLPAWAVQAVWLQFLLFADDLLKSISAWYQWLR